MPVVVGVVNQLFMGPVGPTPTAPCLPTPTTPTALRGAITGPNPADGLRFQMHALNNYFEKFHVQVENIKPSIKS